MLQENTGRTGVEFRCAGQVRHREVITIQNAKSSVFLREKRRETLKKRMLSDTFTRPVVWKRKHSRAKSFSGLRILPGQVFFREL